MRLAMDRVRGLLGRSITITLLFAYGYLHAGDFNIDLCRFRSDQDKVILELYLGLSRTAVLHRNLDDTWLGVIEVSAFISSDSTGLATDTWKIRDYVKNPDQLTSGQLIIDARIYELMPGSYSFKVTATDSIAGTEWIEEKSIQVTAFSDEKLSLSDIELAGRILPVDQGSKFDRGGIALLPNPGRMFGYPNLFFFYYIEIYPPLNQESESETKIFRSILNGRQEEVMTLPVQIRETSSGYLADVDSISLNNLPQGTYTLEIGVSGEDNVQTTQKTRFFINRRDNISEPVPYVADSIAVNEELEAIGFLLKPGQQKVLSKMTLVEKSAFLKEFWRRHTGDPSENSTTLREVFNTRIQEADELYSNSRDPGHRTERGRIYVLYGKPGLLERHPLDQDAKPYEIWIYDQVEGGVVFVFVDRTGLGEYELVHSTMRGEINNPDWFELYVRRSGVDTGR